MAYPTSPETSGTRPGVVKIAVNLLYLAAALQIISAILTFLSYGPTKRGYEKAFAGSTVANAAGTAAAFVLGVAVFALIVGIVLAVLATLDAKGSNVARIITWIFGGLTLCCAGLALAGSLAGNSMTGGAGADGAPSAQQIQDAVNAEMPSWLGPTTTTIGVVYALALLAALILLALPAANAFFRKRGPEQQWEPPVPPQPQQPQQGPTF